MLNQFIFECKPEISSIREIRTYFQKKLSPYINEVCQNTLLLVVSEWIVNIVMYSLPPAGNIRIGSRIYTDKLEICVSDNGGHFENFSCKKGALPDVLDVESLDTGGMGIFLLQHHFPQAAYYKVCGGNQLVLNLAR